MHVVRRPYDLPLIHDASATACWAFAPDAVARDLAPCHTLFEAHVRLRPDRGDASWERSTRRDIRT